MSAGESATEPNAIDLQALRWVNAVERGPLSSDQQRELSAWIAADIRHKGALIRARSASLRLNRLSALAGGRSPLQMPMHRTMTRRRALAIAASAAGAVGLLGWESRDWLEDLRSGSRYVSNIGETRQVTLPDGSVMTLNTGSEVRAHYTRHSREIDLTKGEVLFTVAHDAKREFVVRIGSWSVLAVGTAFAVRRLDPTSMDVMVTEGAVEMLQPGPGPADTRQKLTALQEAAIGADGRMTLRQVPDPELQRRLAWRSGLIVFDGETLREALSEMNRYTQRPLVVNDPELAERRIVGVFRTSDTRTFVLGIRSTLDVETVENGNTILLRKNN